MILVVGDGMGWEMIRAGAITKRVISELESLGVDIQVPAGECLLVFSRAGPQVRRVLWFCGL